MSELVRDFNFDEMNETDIREEIIRPFLHALGYRAGTAANIRTEYVLSYNKIFLGRKDPRNDPDVRGRADYILDVIPYARWVVEAKPPTSALTDSDAEQAYTYASHAEIGAIFYLLTNGLEWKLYRTSYPGKAILEWSYQQLDDKLINIRNVLSPDAIKRLAEVKVDLGKPLAPGIASGIEIVSGSVIYDLHVSHDLPLDSRLTNGLRNGISGGAVKRNADGQIEANISIVSAFSMLDQLNKAMGFSEFTFRTMDEYVSLDRETPTIFTNLVKVNLPTGTRFPASPINPQEVIIPFPIDIACFSEATGFVENGAFLGTLSINYDFHFHLEPFRHLIPATIPEYGSMRGEGRFDVKYR